MFWILSWMCVLVSVCMCFSVSVNMDAKVPVVRCCCSSLTPSNLSCLCLLSSQLTLSWVNMGELWLRLSNRKGKQPNQAKRHFTKILFYSKLRRNLWFFHSNATIILCNRFLFSSLLFYKNVSKVRWESINIKKYWFLFIKSTLVLVFVSFISLCIIYWLTLIFWFLLFYFIFFKFQT